MENTGRSFPLSEQPAGRCDDVVPGASEPRRVWARSSPVLILRRHESKEIEWSCPALMDTEQMTTTGLQISESLARCFVDGSTALPLGRAPVVERPRTLLSIGAAVHRLPCLVRLGQQVRTREVHRFLCRGDGERCVRRNGLPHSLCGGLELRHRHHQVHETNLVGTHGSEAFSGKEELESHAVERATARAQPTAIRGRPSPL